MKDVFPTLMRDPETTRRVARVLLKHIAPKDRADAIRILDSRIGVYSNHDKVIIREIEQYFG